MKIMQLPPIKRAILCTTNKDTQLRLNSPPGLYFVTATTRTGKCTTKLIIE
jgi:hypothetical protein